MPRILITITAPTGVGKTRLAQGLLEHIPHAKLLESVTTRAPRPSDLPGEYFYVSETEFERMRDTGEFLWTVMPSRHGWYGTRKRDVEEALRHGVYISLLVPDKVEEIRHYATQLGKEDRVCSLYLSLHDETEQRRRLSERGNPPDLESRIQEGRLWDRWAETEQEKLKLHFIDATQSIEQVLGEALRCITAHQIPE